MVEYECSRCHKIFNHKYRYIEHVNKAKKCKETNNITIKNKIKCQKCNKIFSRKDYLNVHMSKYCKGSTTHSEYKNDDIQQLKNELEIMKDELNKLKKDNHSVINNIHGNQVNTIINLPQVHGGITPVAFGKEKTDHITSNEYLELMKHGSNSVSSLVKMIHFDENTPENHNVYIPNINGSYATVFNGNIWSLENKKDIIDKGVV